MSLALIRVVHPGTDPRQTTDPSHCQTPLSSRYTHTNHLLHVLKYQGRYTLFYTYLSSTHKYDCTQDSVCGHKQYTCTPDS